MTINQIAAMAAAVACGMRFGEFEPAHRDALVARTKDTIDNGKAPEYTCEDILGTEDASRTFDKITLMLGRFVEESKLVDVVAEKALAMGIENALAAMSMAQRLFGGERAEVIDADLMALVEACLPVALEGESVFDTAIRVLNEYAFMKGQSGALVVNGNPVVSGTSDIDDGGEAIPVEVEPSEPEIVGKPKKAR